MHEGERLSGAQTVCADLAALGNRESTGLVSELMGVGTILIDALIAGLRGLALEDAAAGLFSVADAHSPTGARNRKESL